MTSTSKSVTGKRTPVFHVNSRRKKQILPSKLVNQVKRSLPKESDQELGFGLYDYTPQPSLITSPGPHDPNQFLCLKELLKSKSISVSRVKHPDPHPPKLDLGPAVEVPMEDQAFSVMDYLMERGFSYKPPVDVDPVETRLNSLRAAGMIDFSKVSASVGDQSQVPPENQLVPETEDQLTHTGEW